MKLAVALLLRSALAGRPAQAQSSDAARRLFEEGVAAAQRKDFKEASRSFEAAYKLDPTRDALFGWAQVERLGGNCERAVPLYREFLTKGPAPEHAQAAELGLRRCAETSAAPAPEGPPAAKPTPAGSSLAAPRVETAVRVEAGPPAEGRRGTDWLGGSLVALGTVSVGAGLALVALSISEDRAARAAGLYEDYLAHMDRGRLERGLGIGIGAAGLALATVGVIRLVRTRTDGAAVAGAPGRPSGFTLPVVALTGGARGATLVLGGRF